MSDAHHEQQSLIQTPKQLIFAVAGFFLVIVIGIILLVTFVTNKHLVGAGSESQGAAEITARVRPVAAEGFTLKDMNAPKVLQSGQAVFTAVCAACHATGAAGAPKVGDSVAWGQRIKQGYDVLVQHAIQGIRAMPPKGGNPDLDNVEVARAIVYMTNQSGAKFKEPAVPAIDAKATYIAPSASTSTNAELPTTPATPTASVPAAPAISAVGDADMGKTLYASTCIACHGAGIAGAPKFGDKVAWAPRVATGLPVLYSHAVNGFQGKAGVMPPKGGSNASDADVRAAVDYMVAAAK